MKLSTLLLLVTLLGTKCIAINDVKKLKETIYSFGEQFLKENPQISTEFILSYDDYKTYYVSSNNKRDENIIQMDFKKYLARTKERSINIQNDLGKIFSIKSFDTIRYNQNKSYFIDISIVFKCKRSFDTIAISVRTIFTFIIFNGKLKFIGQSGGISELDFSIHKLRITQNQRNEEFNQKFKAKYFNYSIYGSIPFKERGKWGLISFDSKKILKPEYDSIYPFKSNYALLVINGEYNLIDRAFNLIFNSSKKHIKFINEQYYVLNSQNKYDYFPSATQTNNSQLEDVGVALPATRNKEISNKIINERAALEELNKHYNDTYDYTVTNQHERVNNTNTHIITDKKTRDTLSIQYGFLFIDTQAEFLFGVKNDSSFVITPKGKILFKSNYTCIYQSPGYVDIFNKNKYMFGLYCPYTNVYIEPKYRFIKVVDRDKFFVVVTKNGDLGYLDQNGKELF